MEKPHRLHLVVLLLLLCFSAARAAAVLPGPAAQEDATAANLPLEPESEAQAYKPEGQIHLDLVVTTQAGSPVVGLRAQDFTLFDNGQPAKILSFSGYAGAARPDPPASVTLVLDALRVPGSMGSFEREQVERFLRRNEGHLGEPITLLLLTESGLGLIGTPSADGNALADALVHNHWTRWTPAASSSAAGSPRSFAGFRGTDPPELAALKALSTIAAADRRRPGRKLLIWLGPGWGIGSGNDFKGDIFERKRQQALFDTIVWFSTLLRLSRVSLYSFSLGEDSAISPVQAPPMLVAMLHSFNGTPSPKDVSLFALNRKVLALESGGRVLPRADDLVSQIEGCLREQNAFYTLSFNPPLAAHADEYHRLSVAVRSGELTVRTTSGYYDQPYFSDASALALRRVTVAELEQVLEGSRGESDSDLARQLGNLELTEQVSAAKRAEWTAQLHGKKAREALEALADLSIFRDPPPDEASSEAAPDAAAQQQLLASAAAYLNETIPKLPDFFATRTATEYVEASAHGEVVPQNSTEPLHMTGKSRGSVLYRNGRELADAKVQRHGSNSEYLTTYGTFGPMLKVMKAVLSSPGGLTWNHWEQGGDGPVAVFRYAVPASKSLYLATGCCFPDGQGTAGFAIVPGYHGEIAIDRANGGILRITMQANLDGIVPVNHSDIAVIYGSVEIGGKPYILPLTSVSVVRQRTVATLKQEDQSFRDWGPYTTVLSEFDFSGYHKFRAEVRMLGGYTPGAG